ncbi:hypothetical protein MJ575_21870 [Klebsiella pneumoniae]|nr:hypothetical protein MJ575_21870 [Klebsiella pneumoniae]
MFNFDTATQRGIENGFTGLCFINDAIRTQVLVGQKYNFYILNPSTDWLFSDTDRLIHTASGEFLGLCKPIFLIASLIASASSPAAVRVPACSGIDGLTPAARQQRGVGGQRACQALQHARGFTFVQPACA